MRKREAIIQLHCAGRTTSEIITLLKVAKSTVSYTVKIFKKLGTSEDRPRSGRPRTSRSKKTIKIVQERIRRNPTRSARQLAKNMNLSGPQWEASSKIISSCFLIGSKRDTPVQKHKILDRGKILLRDFNADTTEQEIFFFSDEKRFTVEASVKNQNDRV